MFLSLIFQLSPSLLALPRVISFHFKAGPISKSLELLCPSIYDLSLYFPEILTLIDEQKENLCFLGLVSASEVNSTIKQISSTADLCPVSASLNDHLICHESALFSTPFTVLNFCHSSKVVCLRTF